MPALIYLLPIYFCVFPTNFNCVTVVTYFPLVKPATTLPYCSMHPQSIETGILRVAVVLVHSQLHRFVSRPLRLLPQPERLDRLSRCRVGEVEQRGQRVGRAHSRQGECFGGGVDVPVRGEKWRDVLYGDRRDEDRRGELDNDRAIASPECPALSWR